MFLGESSDRGKAIETGTNKKETKGLFRQQYERLNPNSARGHLPSISSQELVVEQTGHPVESRKEVPSFLDDQLHQDIQKNNDIRSVKQFKSTMACIKGAIECGNLPCEIKEALIKNTRSLLENFLKSSDQTGSQKRQQSGQERKARIDEFNQRVQEMSRNLPMWKFIGEFIRRYNGKSIDEFQARMENISASASDNLLHTEQLSIHNVLNDIKLAHKLVMDYCQKQDGMDALQSASDRLKDSYGKFAILSRCSVKWWKINENLELLEKHSKKYDIKQLDYEKVKKAREAYLEMLNGYQQSNGDQERLRITHEDFQEACCQLLEALWWRQVIKPKEVELLRPSNRNSREHGPEHVNKEIDVSNKTVQEEKCKIDADYIPEGIKDKTVKPTFSLIGSFHQSADIASPDSRAERVNKKIDRFNKTTQEIKGKINAEYLPKEIKGKTIENTFSLISNFQEFADRAVQGCGKGRIDRGKGWEDRRKYEKGISYLNDGVQAINNCLAIWKFINEFQARMENTSASSDDSGSLGKDIEVQRSASEVINKLKSEFKQVYKETLDCYSRFSHDYIEYDIIGTRGKTIMGINYSTIKDKPAYLIICDMAINETRNEWIALAKASHAWEAIQKVEIGNFSERNMEEAKKLIDSAKAGYNALLDPHSCRDAWKSYAEHIEGTYRLLVDRCQKREVSSQKSGAASLVNPGQKLPDERSSAMQPPKIEMMQREMRENG
jgi:hypothetical protein